MRWEYEVVNVSFDYYLNEREDLNEQLDAFGSLGWELVSSSTVNDNIVLFFKRLFKDES